MSIIGRAIQLVKKAGFFLLNGSTEEAGEAWIMRKIRYNTSSAQFSLGVDQTGAYTVLTITGNSTNNQKSGAFCSANDNTIDLSQFSKLILEYDMTVISSAETSVTREAWVTLFASYNSMFASSTYQHTGGISFTADAEAVTATIAGTTVTNQKLELPISNPANPLIVAIGLNSRGNNVNVTLTVKSLSAAA